MHLDGKSVETGPAPARAWALRVLGLVLLLLGSWMLARLSPLSVLSSTKVPESPFPHIYIQSQVGSANKCLVTDRAGATPRRSEPDPQGARWKCTWRQGPDGPVLSALTGKEPAFLFLPQGAVVDPVFPEAYRIHRPAQAVSLPPLRWVHLFRDRIYQGLFLQIMLPTKNFTERMGLGRGEILEVTDGQASCWNRKLKGKCLLWNGSFIAEAIFPAAAPDPALASLERLLAETDLKPRAFLLTELASDSQNLRAWPLPLDLGRQLGEPGEQYFDQRYPQWIEAYVADAGAPEDELDLSQLPRPLEVESLTELLIEAAEVSDRIGVALDQSSYGTMAERLNRSPSAAWLRKLPQPESATPETPAQESRPSTQEST